MSDLYSTLGVSPKKRCPPSPDDAATSTPKKLRTAVPLTPASISRRSRTTTGKTATAKALPDHLSRLCSIYNSLQRAISHALATCAVSPTADSGHVRNVVNHLSLKTYSDLSSSFDVDDLKRLCWIWEWDGKATAEPQKKGVEEDNPFLDDTSGAPADWTRGAMGYIVSATTHFSRQARQRVPAYGIGIEIEMDIDKDMGSGMAAVARWTAGAHARQKQFRDKLEKWVELHADQPSVPAIPLVDLPRLAPSTKASSLTMKLASASPKGSPSKSLLFPPASSTYSPVKSPTKKPTNGSSDPSLSTFAIPASPTKRPSALFPQTLRPHSNSNQPQTPTSVRALPVTPQQTPSSARFKSDSKLKSKSIGSGPDAVRSSFGQGDDNEIARDSILFPVPITPSKQKGTNAETAPNTPTSSRRQALYERIRQKSLTTPTRSMLKSGKGGETPKVTRDQLLKMSQDEMRRRCILGRLAGIAESVWMLFSTPASSASTPSRKRRALPASDVVIAIIKSSPVPLSAAEANESLAMLVKLCPFFLKDLNIDGEEWFEMPAPSSSTTGITPVADSIDATPTKRGFIHSSPLKMPLSPGGKIDSAELIHRSPRRVKKEAGGLREVREIIRRELELQD